MSNPFEIKTKSEIELLSDKVITMEMTLKAFKQKEKELKDAKEQLRLKMLEKGVKTWQLNDGTKITATEDTPAKTKKVVKFCEGLLKNEMPDIYEKYSKEFDEVSSPRKGSLRITFAKEGNNE